LFYNRAQCKENKSMDVFYRVSGPKLTLRSNGVNLLSDPGDDGEVLGEVGGQDPGDPVRVQILQLAQFWKKFKDSLDDSVPHR